MKSTDEMIDYLFSQVDHKNDILSIMSPGGNNEVWMVHNFHEEGSENKWIGGKGKTLKEALLNAINGLKK